MIQYEFLIVQFLVLKLVIDFVKVRLNVDDQLQSLRFVPKRIYSIIFKKIQKNLL